MDGEAERAGPPGEHSAEPAGSRTEESTQSAHGVCTPYKYVEYAVCLQTCTVLVE